MMLQLAKRSIKRIRPGIVQDSKRIVRELARHRVSRDAVNLICDRLDYDQQAAFGRRYAWIFQGSDLVFAPSVWNATFAGKQIRLPLGKREAWLEWMLAVSFLGHDVDVKRCYETLLRSPTPPRVFFDIGANYGLHSLLVARHGVRTIAFEPNPACHDFYRQACALNGISCELESLALDDRSGVADFWFPETLTWLGTLDPTVAQQVQQEHPVRQVRVQTTTLDAYVDAHGAKPDLVKIDTEGNELRVVRGGLRTLESCRPLVIVESWADPTSREELFGMLQQVGYRIIELPLPSGAALERGQFAESRLNNFLAGPQERFHDGVLQI